MKLFPLPPPFVPMIYTVGYNASSPLGDSGDAVYDTTTGMITLKPGVIGRFVIGIACHEWRGGAMINTTHVEFNLVSLDCSRFAFHANAGADTIVQVGDSITLHASEAASYGWSPSLYLSDTTVRNPVGVFPEVGTYTYALHEVTDSGCTSDDSITVQVVSHMPSSIVLPNAFTPNGDHVNDVLLPLEVRNARFEKLIVYDRTGQKVFESSVQSNGWDGTVNGKQGIEGVYFWQLRYVNSRGQEERQNGNVTLLR